VSEAADAPKIKFVNVFYATDRKETGNPKPEKYFGSDLIPPHSDLNLGICKVSIPTNHEYATLESYRYLKFETENNPEEHVKVLKLTTLAETNFISALQSRIQKSEGKEIFVFIHGYNVSFDDAVRRTAQLAYDLKVDDKRGAPIVYSWPSRKKFFSYVPDETNIRATAPRLQKFLEMLAASSGAKHIHLLAHSMGSQGLSEALNGIGLRAPSRKLFDQVIFAAPDVDVNLFQLHLRNITNLAERITLYACTGDKALLTSRKVHGGLTRLGLFLGLGAVIDTVDVTTLRQRDFIEHSYYGDVGVVLRDIQKLLRCRCSAEKRCVSCLKSTVKDGASYWVLGHTQRCAHDE
jgi:esterase/lipase superfamily enzyme